MIEINFAWNTFDPKLYYKYLLKMLFPYISQF